MTTPTTVHVYPALRAAHFQPLVDALSENDHKVLLIEDLAEHLPDIEYLVAAGRTAGLDWSSARKLRLIQVGGAGVDKLLPAKGLAEDVIITNSSGSHEPEMPEFVIAAMMAMTYRLPTYLDQQRARQWKRGVPVGTVAGSTMCVVGLGTIGQSIATRARALGMRVTGVRRSGAPVAGVDQVATMENRLEAIAGANVLVVVTPLTAETDGLISREEIAALNPQALLIDVSRGGVTDIDAVVDALGSGQLAGAAMDVFRPEPVPPTSPLWEVENLLITPHIAGTSPYYVHRWAQFFLQNLAALEAGTPLINVVDRSRGY